MKKLAIALLAGAGLFAGVSAASAADTFVRSDIYTDGDAGLTQVRMVCNENGQCWNDRGRRRVVVREYDSYNQAPRAYYSERREHYNSGPSVGIGIGPRGVGVGVGAW